MKKVFFLLFLLSACTGGGLTGTDGSGPGGAVGEAPVGFGGPLGSGQASGDGVLGSQSSSADIDVAFYRVDALDFENEAHPFDALIERPMVGEAQAFGNGQVRKIQTTAIPSQAGVAPNQHYVQVATSELGGTQDLSSAVSAAVSTSRWVRAIQCGNFPDVEIENKIPPQEKDQPWAADKLLWFVLNLPRPNGSGLTKCSNPTYRDFPIGLQGEVDLSELSGSPQDVLLFSQVREADFAAGGALSTDEESPLDFGQWMDLAKRPRLRVVRLLPHGETIRIHRMPKAQITVLP